MEVQELHANDPSWWPTFCAEVAETGQYALKKERKLRGWSWGALWKWVVSDQERYSEYAKALEAYAQMLALETVGIADDSEDAKLRVDTRFKVAGKVDRVRWGDQVTHNVVVDPFGEMLKRVSERKLAQLKASQTEKVIEGEVLP